MNLKANVKKMLDNYLDFLQKEKQISLIMLNGFTEIFFYL